MIGKSAPDFTLTDLSGKTIKMSELKGKPVVLVFWNYRSQLSRKQLIQMDSLGKKFADIAFIGVVDSDKKTVAQFVKMEKISSTILLDRARVFEKYEVKGAPDTFYIDRDGKIRFRLTGFIYNNEADILKKLTVIQESNQNTSSGKHYAVICAGSYGDKQHYDWYWGATSGMYEVLKNRYSYKDENIYFLFSDNHEGDSRIDYVSTKQNISKTFALLSEKMLADDTLFCYFVGHGSQSPKGSDYATIDGSLLDSQLNAFRSGIVSPTQTYVFTQCNSGGFCKALSKDGTVVITSTQVDEPNMAGFAEAIHDALNDAKGADSDGNGKVSIGEAYNYTLDSISSWYKQQGIPLPEHCQIEDNGDGVGSYGKLPVSGHGEIALSRYLE